MRKSEPTRRRVTPGEAVYIVDRLIQERRLSNLDVARLVAEMHTEISELEERLRSLREAAGSRPGSLTRTRGTRDSATLASRHQSVSPEQAKSRRLQGEYMGLIRHVQGPDRARMKKLASDQGREAAIKAMRASLSK